MDALDYAIHAKATSESAFIQHSHMDIISFFL